MPRHLGLVLALLALLVLVAAPVAARDETAAPGSSPAAGEPTPGAAAPAQDPFAVIPVGPVEEGADDDPLDKLARDPVGNGLAVVVLLLLLGSLVAAPLLAVRGALPAISDWTIIVLAGAGMAIAAYLANVETSGSEAVCGPVGDCNAVQESEYSQVFGVHIGVLGLLGYGLIAGLWVVARLAGGRIADVARVLIGLGALFGVAFSSYLTFLEPFVIGATCMWCITSALLMLALLWVSAGPAYAAWRRLRGTDPDDAAAAPA